MTKTKNPAQAKFATARAEMSAALIERDSEIDLVLTALLCGENPLLVGPPGCLAGDTRLVYLRGNRNSGRPITIAELYKKFNGIPTSERGWLGLDHIPTFLHSVGPDGTVFYNQVLAVLDSGVKKIVRMTFDDGSFLRLTPDHPVAVPSDGNVEYTEAIEIFPGQKVLAKGSMKPVNREDRNLSARPPRVIISVKYHPHSRKTVGEYSYGRVARARLVVEASMNSIEYEDYIHALKNDSIASSQFQFLPSSLEVHHKDEDTINDHISNLEVLSTEEHARLHGKNENFNVEYTKELTVVSVVEDGEEHTYDIQMASPANNFCANGIFVHNTGKSFLLDSVFHWINGTTKKFSILFTKFTTPEEVFGPVSVMGLKEDKYRRITTGKLPEADVAFVDEIFKGSSAINNTTLRIMNERTFENGDGVFRKCPLLMLMGASNEWPGGDDGQKELGAMFDRFLLRKKVQPIRSAAGRKRLLWGGDHTPKFSQHITRDEVAQAIAEAAALPFSDDARDCFDHIIADLAKEGVCPGDRRQFKSVGACRAHAYLCGADEVLAEHLTILAHTLWDDPTEQPEKVMKVVLTKATPETQVVNELLMTVEDVVAKCTPTEAVPKLQAIAKALKQTKDSTHKTKALAYVAATIKDAYEKVVGAV